MGPPDRAPTTRTSLNAEMTAPAEGFVLPAIKAEPVDEADVPGQAAAHTPTTAPPPAGSPAVEIKREIKQEPVEEILPEIPVHRLALPVGATVPSVKAVPSVRPVRLVMIKKELKNGVIRRTLSKASASVVMPSNSAFVALPQTQATIRKVVTRPTPPGAPIVSGISASRPVLRAVPVPTGKTSTIASGVTIIRPTPFEMLYPKPMVSARSGTVVTPIRLAKVTQLNGKLAQVRISGQGEKQGPAPAPSREPVNALESFIVPVDGEPLKFGQSAMLQTSLPKVITLTSTRRAAGIDGVSVKPLRRLAPKAVPSILASPPMKLRGRRPLLASSPTDEAEAPTMGAGQEQPPCSEPARLPADEPNSKSSPTFILTDGGGISSIPPPSTTTVPTITGRSPQTDELAELIEFDPELFDIASEASSAEDGTLSFDFDSSPRQPVRSKPSPNRGSRKRILQQPPSVLPPPSLTPNGISQSGLVRQARGRKPGRAVVGEFVCDFAGCGKIFIRKQNLRDHRRVHTNDRPYKCKFCSKAFKQASHVIDHQRLHTKVKPFLCRVCGAGFVQAGQLNNHIRKHTIDKRRPFPCPRCPFGGSNQDELDEHLKESHAPSEADPTKSPYDCSLCIYRGSSEADLEEHMSRHVHLRKFACSHCKYRAHTKSRLDMHLMLHTGEKPFECEICGKQFRQKSQRETHVASQHREPDREPSTRRTRSSTKKAEAARVSVIEEPVDLEPDSLAAVGQESGQEEADQDVKPDIAEEVLGS